MKKKASRKTPKRRVVVGNSDEAIAKRERDFALAYINNGRNGLQAAISAGYSERGAGVTANRLLKRANVIALIKECSEAAAAKAGLEVERTMREIANLAYSDPANVLDNNYRPIPLKQLSRDARASIASIEFQPMEVGKGKRKSVKYFLKKIRLWDKNAALEKAAKIHGLYREDNDQMRPVIVTSVNYADQYKPKA